MLRSKQSKRGASLIGVLVASIITAIVAVMLSKLLSTSFKSQRFIEMKDEMTTARRSITSAIDCEKTIPIPATICDGVHPILLRNASGDGITEPLETASTPIAGAGKFGAYYVKASCSTSEKTLTVRVAKASSAGVFVKDPLTNRAFDFDRPPNPILGVQQPICQERLGGTLNRSCPPESVVVGIRSDGSFDCKQVAHAFTTDTATLKTFHAGCTDGAQTVATTPGTSMTAYNVFCISAANRFCIANGFTGGYPVEVSVPGFVVFCVGI